MVTIITVLAKIRIMVISGEQNRSLSIDFVVLLGNIYTIASKLKEIIKLRKKMSCAFFY